MKTKITRLIFFILTITTFTTIFIFSNENGEKSSSTSRGFVKSIIEIIPTTRNLEQQKKQEIIENSQTVIRKLAHFSVYTVLGINLMGFMSTYDKLKQRNRMIIALLVGAMYATSDEIHQMFSGERTPAILDVLIDSTGVLFGILILLVLLKITNKKDNKKSLEKM